MSTGDYFQQDLFHNLPEYDTISLTGSSPISTVGAMGAGIISNCPSYTNMTGPAGPPTYIVGNTGSSGTGGGYFTLPASGNVNYNYGQNWGIYQTFDTPNSLQVKGDAEFEGDVKIKGKSILETLNKLEERLAILKPNKKLEEKWNELRELATRYRELEKEILEKEKIMEILKR